MSGHRNNSLPLRTVLLAGAALAGSLYASTAHAQAPTALQEVVVTAERREQRLVDVGAAVSAVSAAQVRESRVEQLKDLIPLVPNTDMKENFAGLMPVVTLRGVGLDDISSTSNPGVGVYIDEVPLATLTLMNTQFFDVQRIEVLKGPQGTLYGRNTTGGAINILSAPPTDQFQAAATAGYGNYETVTGEVMINGPVAPNLNLRLAAKTVHAFEGYTKSDRVPAPVTPALLVGPPFPLEGAPGSRTIGKRHIWLGRLQADWQASEELGFLLKLEGVRERSESAPPKGFGAPPIPGVSVPLFDPNPDPFEGSWGHGITDLNVDSYNATLRTTYDFGGADLTAVTSYIDLERFFGLDGDGTGYLAYSTAQADRIKQFTQEVRLSGAGERFDWIVGAFYSHDHVTLRNETSLFQFAALEFGAPIPLVNNGFADQTTDTEAVFASVTWHLTDKVDLVGGLRGTWEQRDFEGFTHWGSPGLPFNAAPQFGLGDANSSDIAPGGFHVKDDHISHKIALNWRPVEDTLIYLSEAQSTKSGGFFSETTTNSLDYIPYRPERLRAFELGGKIQRPTFALNAAVFYYDYKDMQAQMTNPGVAGQVVRNIPKAKLYGLDLDATVRPVSGLTLQAGVGLLHSRLGAFPNPFFPGGLQPAGNTATNAPKFSASGLIRYEFPVSDDWQAALQLAGKYQSHTFRTATNSPGIETGAYATFDARASMAQTDGGWEVAAWVKNLGDEHHRVNAIEARALGIFPVYFNQPRTYGIELTRRFN